MKSASDISADAMRWLIRLEAQSSPQTWEQFEEWLDCDTRHRAEFIRMRTAWRRCDCVKLLRPDDGTIDPDLLTSPQLQELGLQGLSSRAPSWQRPGMQPGRRRWLVAVSAVVLAAFAGWMGAARTTWKEYDTNVGGHQRIALSDGSSIALNTDSLLRVRFSSLRRDVELMRGEALFNVAHEATRPFYVTAAGTIVRAVGTAFTVRIHEDGRVEVFVTEGRVAIGTRNPAVKIDSPVVPSAAPSAAAYDSVLVGSGTVAIKRLSAAHVPRKLAWTNGRISFDGETLTEAVREFNRYNRQRLEIADPAIRPIQVGGSFETADPESFVAALERAFGIRRAPASEGDTGVIRLTGSATQSGP